MGSIEVFLAIVFLLSLSALFSGLTLGFFTLNKYYLKRKAELGDKQAEKIYNIRENGNLLLCTLLIGNVAVNSILSIFLDSVTSSYVAGLAAIFLIVIFGEMFPQALFARHALKFGSKFVWVVEIFIFIFYPVAKPLAMILDRIIGEELPMIYSKKELAKLIDQQEEAQGNINIMDADEKRIMKGVLSYSEKSAGDIMTPRVAMVSMNVDQELNRAGIDFLRESGHSRIPVYKDNPDNIVGILYVKELLGQDLEGKRVGDLARCNVIFVSPLKPLDDLLNDFKQTHSHLFVVVDRYGCVVGIVSIEDVLEEIIGAEIVDEFDLYEDLQKQALDKLEKRTLL